ncbi:hypothetical protein EDD22DRAFT_943175, partial [Suillus occidentalis]
WPATTSSSSSTSLSSSSGSISGSLSAKSSRFVKKFSFSLLTIPLSAIPASIAAASFLAVSSSMVCLSMEPDDTGHFGGSKWTHFGTACGVGFGFAAGAGGHPHYFVDFAVADAFWHAFTIVLEAWWRMGHGSSNCGYSGSTVVVKASKTNSYKASRLD